MKPQNTDLPPALPDDASRESLSALADGDGDSRAIERACGAWRDDLQARRCWHAYHLIGDVLRSDELASTASRDEDFLISLRKRLAEEPVVLAPSLPLRRSQPWLVPVAVAAGFGAVAVVLVLARGGLPGGGGPGGTAAPGAQLAAASRAEQALSLAVPRPSGNDAGVLRDPRLDEFLRAHQTAGPGMTMAVPGGTLRRVDIITSVDSGR